MRNVRDFLLGLALTVATLAGVLTSADALTPAQRMVVLGGAGWALPGNSADLYFAKGLYATGRSPKSLSSLITFSNSTGGLAQWNDGHYSTFPTYTNLLTYSADLTQSGSWGLTNTTSTATTLTDNTSNSTHSAVQTSSYVSGVQYTFSGTFTAGTATVVQLTWTSAAFSGVGYADFNLALGTVSQTGGTLVSSGITALGGGAYRCWITAVATATTTSNADILLTNNVTTATRAPSYIGVGTTLTATALQVEPNNILGTGITYPSPYITTTSAAISVYAPRITDKGWLIEQASTNQLLYSANNYNNSHWSQGGGAGSFTITDGALQSPDNTTSGSLLVFNSSSTFTQTVNGIGAASMTFSIFVKQGSGATQANTFGLYDVTTASVVGQGSINLSTGVVTQGTGVSSSTYAGNGWWRYVLVVTSGITAGDNMRVYIGSLGSWSAGWTLNLWNAQLEALAFPTSPILTTSAAVTRSADSAQLAGPSLAAALSAKAMYFQTNGVVGGTNPRLLGYNGGAGMFYSTSSIVQANDGTNAASATLGNSTTYANSIKSAFGVDSTSMTAISAGGSLATQSTSVWPTTATGAVYLANNLAGARPLNGYLARATFGPIKGQFNNLATYP